MSPTRRSLLRSASLGALALGGCLRTETPGGDGSASTGRPTTGSDDDPTVLKVRNPGDEAAVLDRATGSVSGSDEGDTDPAPISREIVASADRADELLVAEGVDEADRSRVRSFLDETDYETETVFVSRAGIRSCYRFRIRSVSWEPGRVEYEYCRELRPPDAACEADTRDAVGLLFRLPIALDSRLSGSGSSGHSPCRAVGTEYDRIDANATVPGNNTGSDGSEDSRETTEEPGGDSS